MNGEPTPDWRTEPNAFGTVDLTDQQRELLTRHGYPADLPARGITGPPNQVTNTRKPYGQEGHPWGFLRNHICQLEGIRIDGHETSDHDPNGQCIHCREDR